MVVFAPKALALTSRWNQNLRLNMLTASALRYFFRKGAQSHLTLCAPKSLLSIHCPPLVQVFLGLCLLLPLLCFLLPLLYLLLLLLFLRLLSSCHAWLNSGIGQCTTQQQAWSETLVADIRACTCPLSCLATWTTYWISGLNFFGREYLSTL